MASQKDVRAIALALEDVVESPDRFAFAVARSGAKPRGFVWAWNQRVGELRALVSEAWRCVAEAKKKTGARRRPPRR